MLLPHLAALAVPDRPEGLPERSDLDPRGAEEQLVAVGAQVAPALAPPAAAPQRHRVGGQRQVGPARPGPAPGKARASDKSRFMPYSIFAITSPAADRAALLDPELADLAGAVRGDLVLHLHRLDHADQGALLDLVPFFTATFRTVPWIGETSVSVALAPAAPAPARSRLRRAAQPGGGARVRGRTRGADHLDAVEAPVDLDLVVALGGSFGLGALLRPGPAAGDASGDGASDFSHLRSPSRSRHVSASRPLLGGEDRPVERDQGHEPADLVLAQGPQHPRRRPLAIDVPDDQLGDHRVIERGHLRAGDRRPSRPARPARPARDRR